MARTVSIKGPIERVDDKLMLLIPLFVGGQDLAECAKGIGYVEGDMLKVEIMPWLADKLGVAEGTIVSVDNIDGKFRIQKDE